MATCKKSNPNNSWLLTLEEKRAQSFPYLSQHKELILHNLSCHNISTAFVSLTSFSSKGKRPLSSKSLIFWEISIRILKCSDKQQLSYYTPEIWPVFVPLHRQRYRGPGSGTMARIHAGPLMENVSPFKWQFGVSSISYIKFPGGNRENDTGWTWLDPFSNSCL